MDIDWHEPHEAQPHFTIREMKSLPLDMEKTWLGKAMSNLL